MSEKPKLIEQHRYRLVPTGNWNSDPMKVMLEADTLTVDNASLLSIMGCGFTFGNRTIFREIVRLPWMCREEADGCCSPYAIPAHGFKRFTPEETGERLFKALQNEAACLLRKRKEAVLLLSGGLDSRIVGLAVSEVLRAREADCHVRTVTWGSARSRDVVYGDVAARMLGMEWSHLDLTSEHLWENVITTAMELGASIFPSHLHRITWSRTLPPHTLVIAGSYGDSVGRAEFSGLHLIELGELAAHDTFGLLKASSSSEANQELARELAAFHEGKPKLPSHVLREHEMQGIYMRNGLSDAMGLVSRHCCFEQMFTDPSVFGLMWSVHPSLRTDEPYAWILRNFGRDLAEIPWARTNRALRGRTRFAQGNLKGNFHDYRLWTCSALAQKIRETVDPDWFAEQGVFEAAAVRALLHEVLSSPDGLLRPAEVLLWLASFRLLVDRLRTAGKTVLFESAPICGHSWPATSYRRRNMRSRITRKLCEASPKLEAALRGARDVIRGARREIEKRRMIALYPPE